MAFTRNRPTAAELLQSSQPLIKDNFNSSDDSFGVDHYQFSDSTANNGRHKAIHQYIKDPSGNTLSRSGAGATYTNFPANIANINQIITGNYTPDSTVTTTDSQLFTLSGLGTTFQMTGLLIGAPATGSTNLNDGWCWSGGILIQWGYVDTPSSGSFSSGAASGTVTFKDRIAGAIPFPNNIFTVQAGSFWSNSGGAPSGAASVNISRSKAGSRTSTTRFDWQFNSNSSKYEGFTWMAIGN